MGYSLEVTVNGVHRTAEVEARELLAHFLRDTLGLTGTHIGCDTTSCGACTVLLNGTPVKSCSVFAVQATGCSIETVEGLAKGSQLHPLQQAFWDCHGLQCGYCTPGMLMTCKALLERNPQPSEEEIRKAISGNMCRCTGYMNIVRAVQQASGQVQAGAEAATA